MTDLTSRKTSRKLALLVAAIMLVPAVGSAQSLTTPNKCEFFEHFDYQGESFMLHTGHVLSIAENPTVSEEYSSGSDFQVFVAPQWQGRISASKVAPGCYADIVTTASGVSVGVDVPQFDGNYNDNAVIVGCRCNTN